MVDGDPICTDSRALKAHCKRDSDRLSYLVGGLEHRGAVRKGPVLPRVIVDSTDVVDIVDDDTDVFGQCPGSTQLQAIDRVKRVRKISGTGRHRGKRSRRVKSDVVARQVLLVHIFRTYAPTADLTLDAESEHPAAHVEVCSPRHAKLVSPDGPSP